ncbi:MAG: hypothetical protein JSV50_15815 [Desulfobacteraceae bacterium]|nr:MAG: hypothetical protein JSV50_15815 [Desulfobacteraceae bacterium]
MIRIQSIYLSCYFSGILFTKRVCGQQVKLEVPDAKLYRLKSYALTPIELGSIGA